MNRVAVVTVSSGGESVSFGGEQIIAAIAGGPQNVWSISNKYYEADVLLEQFSEEEQIPATHQAVLILYDFYKGNFLAQVKSFWAGQTNVGADVQILVGMDSSQKKGDDEDVKRRVDLRKNALEWCIGNGFELIMWSPGLADERSATLDKTGGLLDEEEIEEEDDEEEESFKGLKRIRDALQAHLWPEMTMKPSSSSQKNPVQKKISATKITDSEEKNSLGDKCDKESDPPSSNPDKETSQISSKETPRDDKYTLLPDDLVSSGMLEEMCRREGEAEEEEDGGFESFERLFGQLPKMKETAANLPREKRLDYAEQVVMAFWNALGDGIDEDPDQDSQGDDEKKEDVDRSEESSSEAKKSNIDILDKNPKESTELGENDSVSSKHTE